MIVIIGSIVAVFAVTALVVLIVVNRKKAKENPIEVIMKYEDWVPIKND